MIDLLAARTIMRSKFLIMLFWILISWSKLSNINEQIRPHEQIEFWSHDRKFDLLKKLNFDLMKFDLMIISLPILRERIQLLKHDCPNCIGSNYCSNSQLQFCILEVIFFLKSFQHSFQVNFEIVTSQWKVHFNTFWNVLWAEKN
jgi:hypothetical protein